MIDYQLIRDKLLISHFNNDGGISFTKLKIPDNMMYRWKLVKSDKVDVNSVPDLLSRYPDKYALNQDGKLIVRVKGNPDRYRINEILIGLPDAHRDRIYNMVDPLMYFIDIETEVLDDGFPDVENPEGKILTVAYCNNKDNKVYIMAIKDMDDNGVSAMKDRVNEYLSDFGTYDITFLHYPDEKYLLKDLLDRMVHMPVITGWNFTGFDWPYIINRCIRLGLDTRILSPTKTMRQVAIKNKYDPTKVLKIQVPMHRVIFDYMGIWEKWDRSVPLKSSSSLDFVSGQVLKVKKVPYNGTLMDLYRNDFQTYAFYNIVDTILVMLINSKIYTYGCMAAVAAESKTSINTALYASQVLEPMFQEKYLKAGMHFVRDYEKLVNDDKYTGAYVKEPNKGKKDNVVILDFESLFPMIIGMFNIGIDTKLGYIRDGDGDKLTYVSTDGNIKEFDKNTMCYTASGLVFDKTKYSIPADIVNDLAGGRRYNKYAANDMDDEIAELEHMLKSI